MDYIEVIQQFVKPELLVLVPVLYFIGVGFKKAKRVKDNNIPLFLCGCGIGLAVLWVLATANVTGWQSALMAVFTALVQGILCAGTSVLVNQIIKQKQKQNAEQV